MILLESAYEALGKAFACGDHNYMKSYKALFRIALRRNFHSRSIPFALLQRDLSLTKRTPCISSRGERIKNKSNQTLTSHYHCGFFVSSWFGSLSLE